MSTLRGLYHSQESLERAFIELLQDRELPQITVSQLCKMTGLNRSTFYANYADVYELADTLRIRLETEVAALYEGDLLNLNKYYGSNWLRLFYHIRDNQLFYKTYFKLGYDSAHDVNLSDLNAAYQIFPLNLWSIMWSFSGPVSTPS